MNTPHALFLNPSSGGGRGGVRWQKARAALGWGDLPQFAPPAPLRKDQRRDLALAWAKARLAAGDRLFAAVGGDGTVNLAVNALVGAAQQLGVATETIKLGAVAVGSSNDFHKPMQSEHRRHHGSVSCRIDFANASAHDVGVAEFHDRGDRTHFVINSSLGVTAEANDRFNSPSFWLAILKKVSTPLSIVATAFLTIFKSRNIPLSASFDGGTPRRLELSNAAILKNPHVGGAFRYEHGEAAANGRLRLYMTHGVSRLEGLRRLSAARSGRFAESAKCETSSLATLRFDAPRAFAVETDGEIEWTKSVTISVLNEKIRLCP